ncbi:MAG TPA: dephospho-CoA kinase [Ottowia sp.]|uniref:dephospho-CoA kinase n=1 Tax=Ottowia sp. TaxID=1898956 RepID=UPI002CDA0A80|nr:dephospho-CoA kinase [Ottowia sp.]HMN19871.1 dephospho-CoA kinase [Ottowia sp.]
MAPFHLGLTGGIGSGKSTVAALWAARGAAVIDADAISRATTATGGSALPAIAARFGPALIGADGALDRAAMRALVYRDPAARAALEAIIHPLVSQETQRQAAQARGQDRKLVVFDIPLLVEAGARWRARLDRVLVIDCPPAVQVARVVARNQLAPAQVEAILAAQAGRLQRLAAADWVLFNGEGVTVRDLEVQIDRIATRLGL